MGRGNVGKSGIKRKQAWAIMFFGRLIMMRFAAFIRIEVLINQNGLRPIDAADDHFEGLAAVEVWHKADWNKGPQ